jgi:hypothetical protein
MSPQVIVVGHWGGQGEREDENHGDYQCRTDERDDIEVGDRASAMIITAPMSSMIAIALGVRSRLAGPSFRHLVAVEYGASSR